MKTAPRGKQPYSIDGHAKALFEHRLVMLHDFRKRLDRGSDAAFYTVKVILKRLFPGAKLAFYDEDTREFVIVTKHKTYRYA